MEQSIKNKILKYNQQVPRYTSYPTAPHFYGLRSDDDYNVWLNAIESDEALSLYVHIPFCVEMCWYCGCHTQATKRYEPVSNYIDYLLKEIDLIAANLPASPAVQHLHFGGGSPTMLTPEDFSRIISRIKSKFEFSDEAEIAIEVDPRNITPERVKAYADNGVNRVSIGVQDFDQKVLKAVNRPQPYQASYDAIKLFREHGIKRINVDMLYGLPHQTIETIRAGFEKLLSLDPDRISYFGYAHVPWVKKHMRLIKEEHLPNTAQRMDLYLEGEEILLENGYHSIGIDHFAKADDSILLACQNGTLHRNFQGYTTDTAKTMIGFGVSSIGQTSKGFIQNARSMTEYKTALDGNKLPAQKCCVTSHEDTLRARVIEELMCNFRVNLAEACEQNGFNANHFECERLILQPYIDDGLIDVFDETIIVIKPEFRMLVRVICAAFDLYFDMSGVTQKHSQSV